MSATASPPEPVTEETGKPGINFKQVTPANRAKINPIVKHYGKMAHPFTACVRDNRKRFGERAERVCAVVKDLARGTTHWRKGGKGKVTEEDAEAFYEAAGGDIDGLVEMCRADVERRLNIVIEELGWEPVALALAESVRGHPHPGLAEEIVALAETYTELGGEPTGLSALISYAHQIAEETPAGFGKPRKPKVPKPAKASFGASDRAQTYQQSQRARGTGDQGGQFVRKGSAGPAVRAVQRGVGAKEDGKFGNLTAGRVRRFQTRNNLKVDGVVGKQTASALLGNRSAHKLNTGAMTTSQQARLRDGGRSRKRRSRILREDSDDKVSEGAFGLLKRRVQDIARVGGGHGTESGRFASHPIAAIGAPSKPGRSRAIGPAGQPGQLTSGGPRKYEEKAKVGGPGKVSSRRKPTPRTTPGAKRSGIGKPKPTPREPQSVFEVGGKGAKIGMTLNEAEEAVVEAVHKSPAYKQAMKEAQESGALDRLIADPGLDTQGLYGSGLADKPHAPYSDATRKALHAEIIRAATQGTRPKKGQKKEALFMAGGGASGKSSILRAGLVKEPDSPALINADLVKACLPEYDLFRKHESDDVAKQAAGRVHEESSDLAKRLTRYAQEVVGANYVMDGTGDNKPGKFVKALEEARSHGHDVKVTYATLPVETAVDRAHARWEGPERRYVADPILYGAHQGAVQNFTGDTGPDGKFVPGVLQSDFPFEIYDTSTKPPTLLAHRKSGKGEDAVTIVDEGAYGRFLARGEGIKDWIPDQLLVGRDLLRGVESGRVKMKDLTPSQMTELAAERKKVADVKAMKKKAKAANLVT